MRTYLVTGGAGFIGSNYIHYMFGKYGDTIKIINVDLLTYAGNLENLKDLEGRALCGGEPCGQKYQKSGSIRAHERTWHSGHVKLCEGGMGTS